MCYLAGRVDNWVGIVIGRVVSFAGSKAERDTIPCTIPDDW